MAATALQTVTSELGDYVAKAKAAAPIRHLRKPPGSAMAVQRAERLRRLLATQPQLRAVAAKALGVRPADVDAISQGRVFLSAQRWRKLFDAVEPVGDDAA
ncbi:MAG TPA: hypothetical protein VHL31_11350 [Geminicoccus sp.]|jgi:hypothetical protein|uniref:hypothetical protein n=1 Tax=Geminicoccus sp. TaxID=2024832 RepID=UPI002E3095A1|nr:hypothetical protein [Geminicoccus sp.]HEX2526876.1 hypothetical protein [Geminicoccus sp.]